ncbi:hypothetical protein NA56DRAFT_120049 [Hyaloscypha hepaticicola]|uniref:Uncharacterized protein n=1 Tax=Hyaloscypha hepaticicola TaxID=2082293 RepID=A0A2J6Q5V2_9HELO|nr:hypothetical protein NA56DRAFT_120049 [Hyaloscypha hepaticicola]
MPRRQISRVLGEEWTHLAGEKSLEKPDKKGLSHSDSGISLSYDSSSGYTSSSESEHVSGSQRSAHKTSSHRSSGITPSATVVRSRIVTPSSSISNFSRRSPLSTMRNAEYPDVVVRPDLRYCPPIIPPPHEWNSSRTASMSQLIPIANIRGLYQMSSLNFADQLNIREPGKNLSSLPRASTAPLIR